MLFGWKVEITIKVHHEGSIFMPNKDWIAKLFWTTKWTPIKNDAHESFFLSMIPIFPLWNIKTPSTPKHKSLLDRSSVIIPPQFKNAFIIILMKLFKPNLSTTLSTHQDNYHGPRFNNICMDTIQHQLLIVVTLSYEQAINWVDCIALIITLWTSM